MQEPVLNYNKLKVTLNQNKINFLWQGKYLYNLRKNSNYREAIGDGIDSWHDFLAQPEIGMSPTQANKLLNIYELFIKQLKYEEEEIIKISIKTLNYLIKWREEIEKLDKKLCDEIIIQAQVLSFKDFKEVYFDHKNKEDQESKEVRTYEYIIMKKCHQTGNMTKVHDIDSQQIETIFNLLNYD